MSDLIETSGQEKTAKLAYVLFVVGIFFPLTGLISVIIAYVNKNDAPEWLQSHYQFQIRTFWFGLAYLIIGGALTVVLIGWLILLFGLIWIIVRCINGIKYINKHEAHPNPTAWFFG